MAVLPDAVSWYDSNATSVGPSYDAVDPEKLYDWLKVFLQPAPGLVLDLGAGVGRDAAWMAGRGYDVFAVEPAGEMRAEAARRYPNPAIRWIDDRLPALAAVYRLGFVFDVILLGAVWQHVAPGERARAMRKMLGLLRPGGVLALTLRHGPAAAERGMHPVSLTEVEQLARNHGALVGHVAEVPDHMGRPEVSWTSVALLLPDDGTGALPLLRHIILNDQKSATYKLGLLRAICRAADGQAGMSVDDQDNDAVILPLGLIALNWIRLYLPLVAANLPQAPGNAGPAGLGFAGGGFRALLGGIVPRLDLRIGARFSGAAALAVAQALQEAADLIARMPAKYITYPNGGCVLIAKRRLVLTQGNDVVLNAAFLAGFGTLRIPQHLWHALGPLRGLGRTRTHRRMAPRDEGLCAAPGPRVDRQDCWRGDDLVRTGPRRGAGTRTRHHPAQCRAAATLRLEWTPARCSDTGYRPLPALVGVAVWRPLEPAAGASPDQSAAEAGSAAGRRTASTGRRPNQGLVGAGLPRKRQPRSAAAFCR